MCADLYEHFLFSLGDSCYYPSGAPHVSDNRLIAMYHANTPSHNKDAIFHSMQKPDGVVRVVFATVALGMGINFASLNTTIHYGAPSTIEDYFQESGLMGQSGKQGILSFGSHQMHLITKTPVSLGMQNWRLSGDTWRTQKSVDVAHFCTTLILSWLPYYQCEILRSVVMICHHFYYLNTKIEYKPQNLGC